MIRARSSATGCYPVAPMIRDLAAHEGPLPEYDVCIVGSGPAGTTVAVELADSGLRVAVLESGTQKTSARGDRLRRVDSVGITIKDYSRERVLGGASSTWAGLSSPLDPIDFERRPWLVAPGWPFARAELEPYYEAAAARYRFPPRSCFAPDGFARLRAKSPLQPAFERLDEKVFLARATPQHFGREHRAVYERELVDLWVDATVLRLEANGAGSHVDAVSVRTSNGRTERLRARSFVLACGGIENARLLLLSRAADGRALGNTNDQVGRWFMNHPKNYFGVLRLANPVEAAPYWFGCLHDGFAGYGGLRLTEDEQRRRRVLNSYVRFEPLFPWSDNRGVEAFILLVKRATFVLRSFTRTKAGEVIELRDYAETGDDSTLQNERKGIVGWLGVIGLVLINLHRVAQYVFFRLVKAVRPKIRRVRLRNFMEMEPRAEHRVTLAGERDEDGKELPRVTHAPTELDRRSLIELHTTLRAEFERTGLGRLEGELERAEPWPIDQDASHHLGATRMGNDPATSVVDADLKVHGVDNLFCAGGSVFPTSGCANPTFTIVALSIRLARHLRERSTHPKDEESR
ncbi:MAG: GMC family oxidoreductase [Planctomycetes bacterium]|nr:GMC family oxidoreductase [Planctomycetota bacterium]